MKFKRYLKSKGGWIGAGASLLLIFAFTRYDLGFLEGLFTSLNKSIINHICPTGGLECLGWALPLLAFYLLSGFVIGYNIERKWF